MEIFESLFTPIEFKELEPTPDFSPENEDPLLKIFQSSNRVETSDITKSDLIPMKDNSTKEFKREEELNNEKESSQDIRVETDKDLEVVETDKEPEVFETKENDSQGDLQVSHKRVRWGRKQDKELFKQIYLLEKQGSISLNKIIKSNADKMEVTEDGALLPLMEKLNWKYGLQALVVRIKNCLSNKFSVREVRMLKKLCKKNLTPDFEEILYNFPGKSMRKIMQAYNAIHK